MATLIMSFLLIPCSHAHKESVCSHYTYTLKKKHLLDGIPEICPFLHLHSFRLANFTPKTV